jgi:hypothetical protein
MNCQLPPWLWHELANAPGFAAATACTTSYLYSYRAHGQFDAITASERNLRRS